MDGHGIDSKPEDQAGEMIRSKELHSFYVQKGIEEASDNVSGAYLVPSLVKAGRILEMNYVCDMKV